MRGCTSSVYRKKGHPGSSTMPFHGDRPSQPRLRWKGALLQVILNAVRGHQSTRKLSKGIVEIVQEVLKHRGDLAQQADHGLSQDIQEQPR